MRPYELPKVTEIDNDAYYVEDKGGVPTRAIKGSDLIASIGGGIVKISGVQGEVVAVGKTVYRDSADSKFYLASKEISQCEGELFTVLESTNIIDGDCTVTTSKVYVDNASFTIGDKLYLNTAGSFAKYDDITFVSGDNVRMLGYSQGSTILFDVDGTSLEVL